MQQERTILLYETSDFFGPFIKKIVQEGIASVPIWIGTDKECTKHVHDFDYAHFDGYSFVSVPQDIVSKMLPYKFSYMNMASRNYHPAEQDSYSCKQFHELENMFHILISIFYEYFTQQKIDLVILSRFPHLGAELVMYRLAELLNIDRIVFNLTILNEVDTFYCYDLDDYPLLEQISPSKEGALLSENILEKSFKVGEDYREIIKTLTQENQLKEKTFSSLLKELSNKSSRLMALPRFIKSREHMQLVKKYWKNTPDYNAKYIYFPLHLQPEMTTSFCGDEFCDQVLALEYLANILPEGWKIYVKENPIQGAFQRGEEFFIRLAGIKNVVLLSQDVPTLDLITHAKVVSTVCGTAGWEAIQKQKPVIYFGRAWYASFDGAYKFNQYLDIEKISVSEVNLDIVKKQLATYFSKCIPVNLNIYTDDYSEIYTEKNVCAFSDFIKEQITLFNAKNK